MGTWENKTEINTISNLCRVFVVENIYALEQWNIQMEVPKRPECVIVFAVCLSAQENWDNETVKWVCWSSSYFMLAYIHLKVHFSHLPCFRANSVHVIVF